jgi:hypothetical protein
MMGVGGERLLAGIQVQRGLFWEGPLSRVWWSMSWVLGDKGRNENQIGSRVTNYSRDVWGLQTVYSDQGTGFMGVDLRGVQEPSLKGLSCRLRDLGSHWKKGLNSVCVCV